MGLIAGAFLFFSLFSCTARATLIICLRHKSEVFLASDSMLVRGNDAEVGLPTQTNADKIFPFSKTCLIAVANWNGPVQLDTNSGEFSSEFVSFVTNMAPKLLDTNLPLQTNITSVMLRFLPLWAEAINRNKLADPTIDLSKLMTRICFVGYDGESKEFFFQPFTFSGTNIATLSGPRMPMSEVFRATVGQGDFASDLLAGKTNFISQASLSCQETIHDLNAGMPDISEERIVNAILEVFALDKSDANRAQHDPVLIGPPYKIFKITTNEVVRIH